MQNSLETWQKVWYWEPCEPRPLVLQQQVAKAFCSSVLMLAEGYWVKKRKWLLQTMYIHSKPILGLPSVQHLLTQFKKTGTKKEAPFGELMGIQAYIYCPDLWLPSSGLMQTRFQVFWLLLLSHWDNYPRPYHVSQDLEGLTVIVLPLARCTDEKRTLMKVRHRERERHRFMRNTVAALRETETFDRTLQK